MKLNCAVGFYDEIMTALKDEIMTELKVPLLWRDYDEIKGVHYDGIMTRLNVNYDGVKGPSFMTGLWRD